jgi:hypothetical protein
MLNKSFWLPKDRLYSAHITISYNMAYMNLETSNSMLQMVREDGHIDARELEKTRNGCMLKIVLHWSLPIYRYRDWR